MIVEKTVKFFIKSQKQKFVKSLVDFDLIFESKSYGESAYRLKYPQLILVSQWQVGHSEPNITIGHENFNLIKQLRNSVCKSCASCRVLFGRLSTNM